MSLDFQPPRPRPAVADPGLSRPDWTVSQPRDPALLRLDKNENLDPVVTALVARLASGLPATAPAAYPDAAPVYAKLAAHLGLTPRHLLFTAGSDGAIRLTFEAFVSPGDTVIHTSPTFAMYPVYARMFGARAAPVDYVRENGVPVLPLAALLDAVARERPKLVCLPNPDSPTGTVLHPDDLRRVVAAAAAVGAVMLVDEAYFPFHPETCLPLVDEFPNLVVTRTFAKAWGLAGARIGFAAACPAMAEILHKVRPMYEVNGLGLALADGLLDHADAVMESARRVNDGRDRFVARMRALGVATAPSHGCFLHAAFGARGPAVHAALASLALYRRDFDHPCLAGFSRFSAAPWEIMAPVAERIAAAVERGAAADRPL